MAEVKWIKIVTNIFDDEKIRYIESLPNGDETIVIWFRILCLAGKSNSGGLLMMTDRIAYTDDLLASIFQRDIKSIQLALNIFQSLEMIEMIDNKIYLTNWGKHQSLDLLEKKKIYDREYQKQKRAEKLLTNNDKSYDNRTTVVENRVLDIELELEEDKELNIKDIGKEKLLVDTTNVVINHLNELLGTSYRTTTPSTKTLIKARMKEGFKTEDFIKVIDKKCEQWKNDPKMQQYLRPQTLFSTKFESYLNEKEKDNAKVIEYDERYGKFI